MHIDSFGDREYWTATDPGDFAGRQILFITPASKPGVSKVHTTTAERGGLRYRVIYCITLLADAMFRQRSQA